MKNVANQAVRILSSLLALFLFIEGVHANRAVVTKEQRDLQTSTFDYELEATAVHLEVTAVYGFVFNGSTPEVHPTVPDLEELIRLTEIFYRRNLASSFSLTYQNVALTYDLHNWDPSADTLTVDFNASVSFRLTGTLPTVEEVWDVIANIDSEKYISHTTSLATPPELFQWTNSTEISARVNPSTTLSPMTVPPSPTEESVGLSFFTFPTRSPQNAVPAPTAVSFFEPSPTTVAPNQEEPGPSPVAPEYVVPRPTAAVSEEEEVVEDQGDDENGFTGVLTGVQSDEAKGNANLQTANANKVCVMTILSNELTAPNLFYWMMAVRIMYYLIALVLQKLGSSYKNSDKKLHLRSYWLQLIVYGPLLAVFTLSLVTMQNDNHDLVKVGVFLFAHATMLLLALYGMEIFLRSMDKTLVVQRLILIAALLYVIDFDDAGLHNPIDQLTFGAMEAVGACSELAAQWNLINYRSWSDASPLEKERVRPGVAFTLQVCMLCSFVSKIIFLASSIAWYILRFDCLAGSNIVFMLPLVRLLQTPTLLRSFLVQSRLYNRVATTSPPGEIDVKQLDMESNDTEEGSFMGQQDV